MNNSVYNGLELLPQDLSGWNGNSGLFSQLVAEIKPKVIVEVGTWKGQSAVTMGRAVKNLNLSTQIYCIDTWLGSLEFITNMSNTLERDLQRKNGYPQVYYQFISNVVHNNLQDIIIPVPTTSSIGAKYLAYNKIVPDLIYVDASHEEDDVYADVQNYYGLLSNGVIFGDDFVGWPGVNKAVKQFCNEKNISYEVKENNFWLIRK